LPLPQIGDEGGDPLLFDKECQDWLRAAGDSNVIGESRLAAALNISSVSSGPKQRAQRSAMRRQEDPRGVDSSAAPGLNLADLDPFTGAMVAGLLALHLLPDGHPDMEDFGETPLVYERRLRESADGRAALDEAIASVTRVYDSYHCRPAVDAAGGPFFLRNLLPSSSRGGLASVSLSKNNLVAALNARRGRKPVSSRLASCL
jgi:hypothetical protein